MVMVVFRKCICNYFTDLLAFIKQIVEKHLK